MIYTKGDAIQSLKPNAQWVLNDGVLTWLDRVQQPTEAEIDAEVKRLQDQYTANEYSRNRANEYPSVVDQLDLIYHSGIDAWKAKIKETKDKYPKS